MQAVDTNAQTGEVTIRDMTPEEIAAMPWPVTVPAVVSRFQARAALLQVGKLAAADAAVAQADALTKLAWADATEFERASPSIAALAPALGLSGDDLDALFIAASKIKA